MMAGLAAVCLDDRGAPLAAPVTIIMTRAGGGTKPPISFSA